MRGLLEIYRSTGSSKSSSTSGSMKSSSLSRNGDKDIDSILYSKDDIDQQLVAQKKRKITPIYKNYSSDKNMRVNCSLEKISPLVIDNDIYEMTVGEFTDKDTASATVTPLSDDLGGFTTRKISIESVPSLSIASEDSYSQMQNDSQNDSQDSVHIERCKNDDRGKIYNEHIEKLKIKALMTDQQLMYEKMISDLCIRVDESRAANELLISKLAEQSKISNQFEVLYESAKVHIYTYIMNVVRWIIMKNMFLIPHILYALIPFHHF